jgi:hypothetical protein
MREDCCDIFDRSLLAMRVLRATLGVVGLIDAKTAP